MLKTALKPQWILALAGAILVASGFVWLSQWQFDRSREAAPPPASQTETAVPLTEHFRPGVDMLAADADQIVTASGEFLPGKQVLVADRIHAGETGYWVVAAFAVDGAEDDATIPVVRGWQPDATEAPAVPEGEVELAGRLLPTESPIDGPTQGPGLGSLSVAQLINLWDVPSYSGFVVAFEALDGAGDDVGAAASGLAEVEIGPQPQEREINWLNIFYGIEWVVFAGFAVFLWWRLVADDYRREQEDLADAAEAEAEAEVQAAAAQAPADHESSPQAPGANSTGTQPTGTQPADTESKDQK
ncbi:SURF1 family protein [Arthrobacter sp. KK5.5]|uniref:SURF1 family protein n=1 Tax=Arthrobacter sp. KK5.5 TaxID=3373084 RepID=UPI003EE4DFB7